MQRQSIIVLIKISPDPKDIGLMWDELRSDEFHVEAWGSLKEVCTKHGWSYSTVVQKKLPIEWKGWQIHRCPFRALYVQEGR